MGNDTASIVNAIGDFNVIEFAKKVLAEVDSIRSVAQDTDPETKKQYQYPVESRLNAFFRLIGLPMFVNIELPKGSDGVASGNLSGKRHLTPGYYGSRLSPYIVRNSTSLGELAQKREAMLKEQQEEIGNSKMDEAMVKALRSAMPVTINYPSAKTDSDIALAVSKKNKIDVGKESEREVYKALFPLVTTYMKIQPMKNEVARPFLQLLQDQMPDSRTVLAKPFIETVARIRMISATNADDENELAKINAIEENLTSLGVDTLELWGIITSGSLNTLEGFIVVKLLSSLHQLAKRWVKLRILQELFLSKTDFTIAVKTTSSKTTPFGKRAEPTATLTIKPESDRGEELQKLQKALLEEEAMLSLLPSEDSIYGTNSRTATTKNTALMALTDPFTKLLSYNIEQIKTSIQKVENGIKNDTRGIESLRVELELMTGEFTGLSVPDVIAVITALFIIDEEYLVALLDTETKEEMKKDKRLKAAIEDLGNPDGIEKATEAVNRLQSAVQFVFDSFNALVKQYEDRTKRSRQAQNRKRKSKTSRRVSYSEGKEE